MGVAGGYLLGRTRKLRLALVLGGVLAGRKLASQGQGLQGLMGQGSKLLENNPQLKELQNQVTGHLVEVAREAALVTAASRIEALTKSLQAKQQGGEQASGEPGIDSAVGGVTGSLGLKRTGKAEPTDESEEQAPDEEEAGEETSDEGHPQDRGDQEPEGEESADEEEPQEQPQGRGRRESQDEGSGSRGSGEQEQTGRRDRVRGRLRRRRPEGEGSDGSASDDATPRDVAKKASAKKASKPVAAKGR